ncbi:hypothetical protein BD779DRAFT_1773095 [Infundibulicybe gibba]|nr:hypothetical protein BD779DRAFT_1773095 [Infundibulicybe gibba]
MASSVLTKLGHKRNGNAKATQCVIGNQVTIRRSQGDGLRWLDQLDRTLNPSLESDLIPEFHSVMDFKLVAEVYLAVLGLGCVEVPLMLLSLRTGGMLSIEMLPGSAESSPRNLSIIMACESYQCLPLLKGKKGCQPLIVAYRIRFSRTTWSQIANRTTGNQIEEDKMPTRLQ